MLVDGTGEIADCKVDGLPPSPGFFPLCQLLGRDGGKGSRRSTLRNRGLSIALMVVIS